MSMKKASVILFFLLGARALFAQCFPGLESFSGGSPWQETAPGNAIEVIGSGPRYFDALTHDILEAKESIEMECYKFYNDENGSRVWKALLQKAAEGVEIRIVFENIASPFLKADYYDELARAGIRVRLATDPDLPIWTVLSRLQGRLHRKTSIIDGRIVYMGGMNLNDNYALHYDDTQIRIEGPSAECFRKEFYSLWSFVGPSEDAPEESAIHICGNVPVQLINGRQGNDLLYSAIINILDNARDYVWMQNPYLSLDGDILGALSGAVRRGVDVRIMIPAKGDLWMADRMNEIAVEELLGIGVRVFLYEPRFNHSKTIVADDCLCGIGSVNLTNRSRRLNFENMVFIQDSGAAMELKKLHLEREEMSHEILPDSYPGLRPGVALIRPLYKLFHPII